MASRYQYVCPECGNTVPAERLEKRVPGTKAQTRVMLPVVCENKNHATAPLMEREEYTPARREVRD